MSKENRVNTESLAKRLVSRGKNENQARDLAEKVKSIARRAPSKEEWAQEHDQSWKDCVLMQPTEAWDKTDKKGAAVGDQFLWMPSQKYKENFDLIDWEDE
jgi:hypothetical protein